MPLLSDNSHSADDGCTRAESYLLLHTKNIRLSLQGSGKRRLTLRDNNGIAGRGREHRSTTSGSGNAYGWHDSRLAFEYTCPLQPLVDDNVQLFPLASPTIQPNSERVMPLVTTKRQSSRYSSTLSRLSTSLIATVPH